MLPSEEVPGLNKKIHRDLGLRLPWLFDNAKLPAPDQKGHRRNSSTRSSNSNAAILVLGVLASHRKLRTLLGARLYLPSFLRNFQSLRFGKQPFHKCSSEIERILRLLLCQRALVCTLIPVFADTIRQVAQVDYGGLCVRIPCHVGWTRAHKGVQANQE
jgi:hypothetical protein